MRPFVQTIQGEQSSTLKEDIKYLSLLNASLSLTNKWTPRSYGDMSWVSFLLKMLALLHPIISDCHCIVFDRRILSAFCSRWITALSPAFFSPFHFWDDIFRTWRPFSSLIVPDLPPSAPLTPCFVLCGGVRGGGELIVWQTQAWAQSSPHSLECEAASLRSQESGPTGSPKWQNKSFQPPHSRLRREAP